MIQSHLIRMLLQQQAARIPDHLLEQVLGEGAAGRFANLYLDERDVGRKVADFAVKTWEEEIREPRGLHWERIDDFIRGPLGLGWSTADAKGWRPDTPYTRNGMFSWCGAFASWCWGHYGLNAGLRRKSGSSTYRLNKLCAKNDRNIPLDQAQPGDVAIVSDGSLWYGEHITLVVEPPYEDSDGRALITTIEGNARGIGPNGDSYEGVIKRTRPLQPMPARARCPISGRKQVAHVINVFRFQPEDLAA